MIKYSLPKLAYSYDSLEPFVDAKTMEIHYSKHHQAYLDKLNSALSTHSEMESRSIEELIQNLDSVPDDIRMAVRNAGGGFLNHNLFWSNIGPNSGRSEKIDKLLIENFGSVEKFVQEFSDSALNLFGSGWTWLVMDQSGRLKILNTPNQDNPISTSDVKILLALDLWEHAYYLKYQNRRPEFIENWWNVVNWVEVEKRGNWGI